MQLHALGLTVFIQIILFEYFIFFSNFFTDHLKNIVVNLLKMVWRRKKELNGFIIELKKI